MNHAPTFRGGARFTSRLVPIRLDLAPAARRPSLGAVHRSRTDTLWLEARRAAVEHQHRLTWGGAGNRTLALTFTASCAATDTSATVALVWALGFEPRTSSVRGRHSGQAELHPDSLIAGPSGADPASLCRTSPFRLSASVFLPARRARPGSGLFKLPPGNTPDNLAPQPGFEPGTAGLTVRLPYPPGPRGIKKPRSFGRGSINTAVMSAVIRWSPPTRHCHRCTGREAAIHGAVRLPGTKSPPGAASRYMSRSVSSQVLETRERLFMSFCCDSQGTSRRQANIGGQTACKGLSTARILSA